MIVCLECSREHISKETPLGNDLAEIPIDSPLGKFDCVLKTVSVDLLTGRIYKKGELWGGLVSSRLLPGEFCVYVPLLLCDGVSGNVNNY